MMPTLASQLLGLTVEDEAGGGGPRFADIAGIAIRNNSKRSQLIVSRVLAKHVPVSGAEAVLAGSQLAARIRSAMAGGDGDTSCGSPGSGTLVLGFAETACGLAALVADGLTGSALATTTRDLRDRQDVWLSFTEAHSHAPSHSVLEGARGLCESSSVIVLVDDELSTGATAWELIRAIDADYPARSYIVACLIDARSGEKVSFLESRAASAGIPLQVVSLLRTAVTVPGEVPGTLAAFLSGGGAQSVVDVRGEAVQRATAMPVGPLTLGDPRCGLAPAQRQADERAIAEFSERAAPWLTGSVLVIGVEEEMFPAIRVAAHIGADVQSTTRSPIAVIDAADYPIRSGVTFSSAYDRAVPSFLYNGPAVESAPRYDSVLLLLPASAGGGAAPAGLLAASARCTTGTVWTATVRREVIS